MSWFGRKANRLSRYQRASLRRGVLIIRSAEGTRMKGLRAIPADRREAAVQSMLRSAR